MAPQSGCFRRRKLPHWDEEGKPVFITACLKGSISASGQTRIRAFRAELEMRQCPSSLTEEEWSYRKKRLVFGLVDKLLDHESPVCHLGDPDQAEVVQRAFFHFSGERYRLYAFVVMPSHHHWLFLPRSAWCERNHGKFGVRTPREVISHSIQSYTASRCNAIRNLSGQYWQHETFDHWIRSEDELHRVIRYIEANPVKAGLVEQPHLYRWSSAWHRKRCNIPEGAELLPSHA